MNAIDQFIDRLSFAVSQKHQEFDAERQIVKNYLHHIPQGGLAKFFYNIGEFFKSLGGCSDSQVTVKALHTWVIRRVQDEDKAAPIARQLLYILEAAAKDDSNIKNLTTLNNVLLNDHKKEVLPLEEPIIFSDEDEKLLHEIFSSPQLGSAHPIEGRNIRYFRSNRYIMEIEGFPGLIFKYTNTPGIMRERYMAMLSAQSVIEKHQFTSLSVPGSALITCGGEAEVLVERKYPFKHGDEKTGYIEHRDSLDKIVADLAHFVCISQFADIKWRNIPLVMIDGQPRIGLIDLEPGGTSLDGFIGMGGGLFELSPGLLTLFPHQVEILERVAREHSLSSPQLDEAFKRARQTKEREQSIESFHAEKGITAASPALRGEDIEKLPLTDEEKKKCRDLAEDINAVIARQSQEDQYLVTAREWRFTADGETADSNNKQTIYEHKAFIKKRLLPALKQAGLIHSYIDDKQAVEHGVLARRPYVRYPDMIVQF